MASRRWWALAGIVIFGVGHPSMGADPAIPKSATFEPGRLERVQALGDPLLTGSVPTYYTPGYEARARALQAFLSDELQFAKHHLSFRLEVSLAVLDPAQYALAEHQMPYPTPSCTGDPPVAMMPVNWVSGPDVLPKETDASDAVRGAVGAHHLDWGGASDRAYDLWGGHELGHAILEAYGINPGTRWLNEMIASYVLYAYLASRQPDQLWLVDVLEVGGQLDRLHRFASLEDLDAHYLEIAAKDPRNYLWYQAQLFEQTKRIYRRRGMGFLKALKRAFPEGQYPFATLGTSETLRRLDAIEPGFSAWARSLDSMPREIAP